MITYTLHIYRMVPLPINKGVFIVSGWYLYSNMCAVNTVVSNQFHSVKNFLFSSAKPRDFDGMFGTGLLVSMYTTKTPIYKCRFNVTQLKEFLYIFCKRQISIKLFYFYQRLQCTDNYFKKK